MHLNLADKNNNIITTITFGFLVSVLYFLPDGSEYYSLCLYISCALLIVHSLSTIVFFNKGKMIFPRENIIFILFYIYSFLSRYWAISSYFVDYMIRSVLLLSLVSLFLTNTLLNTYKLDKALKLLVYVGITYSFVCLIDTGITGLLSAMKSGSRLTGLFRFLSGNENAIAQNLALTVIILFYLYFKEKNIKWIVLSVLPIIQIIVTLSRTSFAYMFIGLLVFYFLYSIFYMKKKLRGTLKFFVIFILFGIIIYLVLQLPALSAFTNRYMGLINLYSGEGAVDDSSAIRNSFVQAGIEQFFKTPWFGVGFNNARLINQYATGFQAYMHNNFFEVLVNGGIVGGVLFYSVFFLLIKKMFSRISEKSLEVYVILAIYISRIVCDWGTVTCYDKRLIFLISLGCLACYQKSN